MKQSWTALAVALLAIFAATGCNDYGNTFQVPGGASLSGVSPAQVPACVATAGTTCTSFTVTMIGNGFVPKTLVQWNAKTCPTSNSSNSSAPCTTTVTLDANNNVTSVVANLSASLISKPGTASVNTINPGSSNNGYGSNGLSNNITFLIGNPPNPVPTVSMLSHSCATVGNALPLTVTGMNFLNSSADATQVSTLNWTLGASTVQFAPPTTTITSTQITVTIPATSINVTGSATVTVSNPPSPPVPGVPGTVGSGGGTSATSPSTSVTVQSAACPPGTITRSRTTSTATAAEDTPAISLDGRYVAYTAVQEERAQIFFRDTCEGASTGCQPRTSLLSVAGTGDSASGDSRTPSMSSDGRYVAFSSDASDLVESAPVGRQIYLSDTCSGAGESCKPSTILVSTDAGGALIGAESILPSISSSGRFVAFLAITASHTAKDPSQETKSLPGATNSGFRQVFVRDTCLGATNCRPKTVRVSLEPGDGSGTASPAGPALSGKASHVALAGAKAATLFTRSVPVDDSVFLAITDRQH